ncbi:MAG: hypothetical protein Q4D51_04345 [Eubacteriales bacterium]|nr:hypothetical protein [Eubacteriales bacterium]
MAKCKCGGRPRIVSNVVQSIKCGGECRDFCSNPACGDADVLSIQAPLIFDEIGINLCANFPLGVDIATTYPTVTNASIKVLNATYTYGTDNVLIESITGRQNCYVVTLSNITLQFAVNLYDAACRLVATIYPTAVFLPSDTTAPTYDEDTNPTSVELELFAPYGFSYTAGGATPQPVINFVGFLDTNNFTRQGINLSAMAKILDFSTDDSEVTVGVTLVLQSLYFVGYKVNSAGKIEVPKGSIMSPDNTDCMRFVAGDLLDLEIKPLNLEEDIYYKKPCKKVSTCASGNCGTNAEDDTVVIPGLVTGTTEEEEPAQNPEPDPTPDQGV